MRVPGPKGGAGIVSLGSSGRAVSHVLGVGRGASACSGKPADIAQTKPPP